MISFIRFLFLFSLCTILTLPAAAQQATHVVVRAQAKDAKFIGTSMGGALIRITNADTGELLAKGLTQGATGDTQRLVTAPAERYGQLHTEDAAKFETVLELSEPVFVTVEATAPYAKRQAQVTSSTQLWLIPGKHITGDGIILEVPGFAIDVLSPQAHSRTPEGEIPIRANVVMMCGCTVSDGGLWDSSGYEIRALIRHNNKIVDSVPLSFTGTPNTFEGTYLASEGGVYEIIVYAYDEKTGNTGVDRSTVISKR